MEPASNMRSVVDRYVVMLRIPVYINKYIYIYIYIYICMCVCVCVCLCVCRLVFPY